MISHHLFPRKSHQRWFFPMGKVINCDIFLYKMEKSSTATFLYRKVINVILSVQKGHHRWYFCIWRLSTMIFSYGKVINYTIFVCKSPQGWSFCKENTWTMIFLYKDAINEKIEKSSFLIEKTSTKSHLHWSFLFYMKRSMLTTFLNSKVIKYYIFRITSSACILSMMFSYRNYFYL